MSCHITVRGRLAMADWAGLHAQHGDDKDQEAGELDHAPTDFPASSATTNDGMRVKGGKPLSITCCNIT
jgi:hypothetical protein